MSQRTLLNRPTVQGERPIVDDDLLADPIMEIDESDSRRRRRRQQQQQQPQQQQPPPPPLLEERARVDELAAAEADTEREEGFNGVRGILREHLSMRNPHGPEARLNETAFGAVVAKLVASFDSSSIAASKWQMTLVGTLEMEAKQIMQMYLAVSGHRGYRL